MSARSPSQGDLPRASPISLYQGACPPPALPSVPVPSRETAKFLVHPPSYVTKHFPFWFHLTLTLPVNVRPMQVTLAVRKILPPPELIF